MKLNLFQPDSTRNFIILNLLFFTIRRFKAFWYLIQSSSVSQFAFRWKKRNDKLFSRWTTFITRFSKHHKVFNFFHVPLKASCFLLLQQRRKTYFSYQITFFHPQFLSFLHQEFFEEFSHSVHHFSMHFHFAEFLSGTTKRKKSLWSEAK